MAKGLFMEMPSFYLAYPIMTPELAPNTAKFANPSLGDEVKDATVLYVAKASYRSATFGDQFFLLDQSQVGVLQLCIADGLVHALEREALH
jgi:hypothetical protein